MNKIPDWAALSLVVIFIPIGLRDWGVPLLLAVPLTLVIFAVVVGAKVFTKS